MRATYIVSRVLVAAALIAATTSCGSVVRTGSAPVFLVVDKILGVRGASTPGSPVIPLASDVLTLVTTPAPCSDSTPCPTIFSDTAVATLHLALKDITSATATTPSSNNTVTITRVHVAFTRTDGRNTEGLDVPFAFDSGATISIATGGTSVDLPFEIVRNSAKLEAPLIQLRTNGIIISTIANLTFYGQDQVGNVVTATGTLQVDFGNFGD